MTALNCILCAEAPAVAEHKMRAVLDTRQHVWLHVCETCHISLTERDWLTLIQHMILVRQTRVGKRVLPADDQLQASQLRTAIDLSNRLTGEYRLID